MAAQPEVAHNMPDMRDLRHSETYVITEARSRERTRSAAPALPGRGAERSERASPLRALS